MVSVWWDLENDVADQERYWPIKITWQNQLLKRPHMVRSSAAWTLNNYFFSSSLFLTAHHAPRRFQTQGGQFQRLKGERERKQLCSLTLLLLLPFSTPWRKVQNTREKEKKAHLTACFVFVSYVFQRHYCWRTKELVFSLPWKDELQRWV